MLTVCSCDYHIDSLRFDCCDLGVVEDSVLKAWFPSMCRMEKLLEVRPSGLFFRSLMECPLKEVF